MQDAVASLEAQQAALSAQMKQQQAAASDAAQRAAALDAQVFGCGGGGAEEAAWRVPPLAQEASLGGCGGAPGGAGGGGSLAERLSRVEELLERCGPEVKRREVGAAARHSANRRRVLPFAVVPGCGAPTRCA